MRLPFLNLTRTLASLSGLLLAAATGLAQVVNIGLYPTAVPDSFEVRAVATSAFVGTQGVMNAKFTIRWNDNAGGDVDVNSISGDCNRYFMLDNGDGLIISPPNGTGFRYFTFNINGGAALGTVCPITTTPQPIGGFKMIGFTGCATVNIVNDAYTTPVPPNKNYFLSIGGIDRTGAIVSTAIQGGSCTTDCLGVIGGTALPGTPCNDNNACTINDVYTGTAPNCGCAGTPVAGPSITAASSNSPICAGAQLNLTSAATGAGTISYNWSGPNGFSSTNQNTSISGATAAATGTYTLTASNGCGTNAVQTVSVTVNALPATPTISGPSSFCAGSSITLTSSSATGNAWSPGGQTTPSISVNTAGTYSVTVTASGCSATSANFAVTSTPLPATPTISGPSSFCAGSSITLTSSSATGNVWSPGGQTTPSISVNTAGTYSVTVTASGCSATSANFAVTSTPLPATPTISGPSSFCAGSSITLTSSSATGNVWSPGGQTTPSISVNAAGTYSVTVTASGCSATSANFAVTSTPLPATPTISGPSSFCAGSSITLTSSSATGNVWSPGGQTTPSISVNAAGTYSVTVTASGCSATSANFAVTSTPLPATPTISGPSSFCAGSSITLTSSSATGNVWSPGGQTTPSISVNAAGTYSVTVTASGCSATSANFAVTSTPLPATPTISGPSSFCAGSSSTLTSSSATGNVWSPGGQTTPSISVNAAGTYSVTVTASGCSATSANFAVTSTPLPATPTISGPSSFCAGSSITLTSSSATGNAWSPSGQTTQSISVNAAGTYSVTVTASGCSATSAGKVVTVNANPVASCSHTDVTCFGDADGTVTVSATGGTGPYTGTGTTGSLTPGTYNYTVTDALGCTSSCSSVVTEPPVLTANVNATPVSTVGGSNGTATVTIGGGATPYGVLWSPGGATTPTITGLTAGTYNALVTDDNGCTASASGTVNSPNCNLGVTIAHTDVQCFGGSDGTATANVTGATGNLSYVWTPGGQSTQTATGLAFGTYSVAVTDQANCQNSANVVIGQPTQLQVSGSAGTYSCANGTAPVSISASGGTLTYSGVGNFAQAAGGQLYTVTDGNGCQASTTVTVTIPDGDGDGSNDCVDPCPAIANAVPGTACNDGNSTTENDTWNTNCVCVGTPIAFDCAGVPNGTASIDQCGVCSGGTTGLTPNASCTDCAGVVNGTAAIDQCNVCSGGTTGLIPNASCTDCLGVVNGTALPGTACNDENALTENDTWTAGCACVGTPVGLDCAGVPNGTASVDQCGVCSGGTTGLIPNASCTDCFGVVNGTAAIDQCNVCSGGTTGLIPNASCTDCFGVVNGTAAIDQCNVCSGGTTGLIPNASCTDCFGVVNGTAAIDQCNVCSGGTTGLIPNASCTDCFGVINGTAAIDQCNVCSGGTTGLIPNASCTDCLGVVNGTALPGTACNDQNALTENDTWTAGCACVGTPVGLDCAGVPNGTASVDQCGVCSGGTTGLIPNASCTDCAGVVNGTAAIDQCNVCSGGTTGLIPNASCTDCAGVINGTAAIDFCNVCSGGTTGIIPNSTCSDCAGVVNGTASIDQCNVCSGGTTGLVPNATCSDCLGVPNGANTVGQPCDDNNSGTTNDTWTANCNCVGTPVGCEQAVNLIINTDANGNQTTWEIIPQGGGTPLCSGGPYPGINNSVIGEQCCLADGCYTLRVLDSAGDGMTTGGYVLKESGVNGRRIIDNTGDGVFGSVSQIAGGQGFCLPIGDDRLIYSNCDRLFWLPNQYAVATENTAVSATWVVGGANSVQPSNSGYEFWVFDPDGTYSYRRFRSHNVSDGLSPANALRACHMKINGWVNTVSTPHIPANVLMNVRIRGRVAGQNFPFGPACRFKIDPVLALCPPTQLINTPTIPEFSCGVTKPFGSNAKVYAWTRPGATRYQFEFSLPAENNFVKVVTSTTSYVVLNWTVDPLLNSRTYDVRVRISKDQGVTWCPWGDICLLTIQNPTSGMSQGGSTGTNSVEATNLTAWPNPNRGDQLFINLSKVGADVNSVGIEFYDLYGKKVMERMVPTEEGAFNTSLDLVGGMSSGVYLMRVTAGSFVTTERIVIQR